MIKLVTSFCDWNELQALPKKDCKKMEKHVFRVYDTNNDGFIDFVEFMVYWEKRVNSHINFKVVYYVMADGSPEEVLLKIFRIFDINRWLLKLNHIYLIYFSDGFISKKEMSRLIKDMYRMIKTECPETVSITNAKLYFISLFFLGLKRYDCKDCICRNG